VGVGEIHRLLEGVSITAGRIIIGLEQYVELQAAPGGEERNLEQQIVQIVVHHDSGQVNAGEGTASEGLLVVGRIIQDQHVLELQIHRVEVEPGGGRVSGDGHGAGNSAREERCLRATVVSGNRRLGGEAAQSGGQGDESDCCTGQGGGVAEVVHELSGHHCLIRQSSQAAGE